MHRINRRKIELSSGRVRQHAPIHQMAAHVRLYDVLKLRVNQLVCVVTSQQLGTYDVGVSKPALIQSYVTELKVRLERIYRKYKSRQECRRHKILQGEAKQTTHDLLNPWNQMIHVSTTIIQKCIVTLFATRCRDYAMHQCRLDDVRFEKSKTAEIPNNLLNDNTSSTNNRRTHSNYVTFVN